MKQEGLPEGVRSLLAKQRGEFLFGNTAPDVQVISGQTRQSTHFFDLPIRKELPPPWEAFFANYPFFAQPGSLSSGQAAFLAGYLCHLQADWLWIREIFGPVFGLKSHWSNFSHRLYLHNVLRAYLDRQILPGLNGDVGASLGLVAVKNWLPFVIDDHLQQWRDFLAGQLHPGAYVKTIDVFATRQGLSPQAYHQLLSSEERMDQEVFSRLPRQALVAYRQQLEEENLRLLRNYLG